MSMDQIVALIKLEKYFNREYTYPIQQKYDFVFLEFFMQRKKRIVK